MTILLTIKGSDVETEAVIFDKDGTLNNSLVIMPRLARSRVKQLVTCLPWASDLEDHLAEAIGLQGDKIDPHSPMMVGSRQETVTAAATILYLSGQIGWEKAMKITSEAFIDGDNRVSPEQKIVLFPGVKELLEKISLTGGKTAIATNDIRLSAEKFLKLSGLAPYVKAVACADEVRTGKPDPALALLAAKRLDTNPGQCVLVGDSVLDMEMGKLAGVKKTIGVLSGSAEEIELAAQADFIVDSISEILLNNH